MRRVRGGKVVAAELRAPRGLSRLVLHAKTLVADGRVSVVGSTNLDFRSFVFNAECNLAILYPQTAAVLESAFEADLKHAEEIRPEAWSRRTAPHRLGDRAARWLTPFL